MKTAEEVLVIGGGLAGMKASLLLSEAGRRVHLIENSSIIGGRLIRSEDVFPAMECATCMLSPMQQEVLSSDLISLHLLSEVIEVKGREGAFSVRTVEKAGMVDPVACIGCGECWNACPVTLPNDFEEFRSERKAISVPCAGALPNVPWIDTEHCPRYTAGENCSICADSCVFEALEYDQQDSEIELNVSHIILATGYRTITPDWLEDIPTRDRPRILTAPEFERMYASNGPSEGDLVTEDGCTPSSAVILVHPFDMEPSVLNTLYSLKFVHYFRSKLPEIKLTLLLDASYSPDPLEDPYHSGWTELDEDIHVCSVPPAATGGGVGVPVSVPFESHEGPGKVSADMLIVSCGTAPSNGTIQMTELLELESDPSGRPLRPDQFSTVRTSRPGVLVAGSASGPAGAASTVISAIAAAGRVLSHTVHGSV